MADVVVSVRPVPVVSRRSGRWRAAGTAGLAVAGLAALTGCATGTISLENESEETVTVDVGVDGPLRLKPDSGMVMYEQGECLDGPFTVAFEGGRDVEVDGPLCPGEVLRVAAGGVEIAPAE